jgi:secondary thiamine-phosphate synthase enzyme
MKEGVMKKNTDSRARDGATVVSRRINFPTKGNCDVVNITGHVSRAIEESGLTEGVLTVFCPGATGAVTTTEYEPGCIKDIQNWFGRHVPEGDYEHHRYEHDNNGHSHLRASLVGPSLAVPFSGGKPVLGTWQSIVFIDFDIRARRRELVLQFVGV